MVESNEDCIRNKGEQTSVGSGSGSGVGRGGRRGGGKGVNIQTQSKIIYTFVGLLHHLNRVVWQDQKRV